MAYVADPTLTDEENKKLEDQKNLLNSGPGGAPGAPAGAGITGGVPPVGGQPSGTSGSSGTFTNLQRYLTENGPQSLDLANQVAGNVKDTGEAAQTAAQGVVSAGQQAIDAARVKPTGVVDQAATDPTSVDSDPTKKAEFLKERDAAYTGPAGLEDVTGYQDAQAKVKAAMDKVNMTGSEVGRTQILKDMGGPGYGEGKADLNQLLLSGNPDAAGIVSKAADPYRNLTTYLSSNSDAERAAATAAATEAAATKAAVADRFTGNNGVIPTAISGLDQRVADARQATGAEWSAITDKLNNLQPLTDRELSLLGISKDEAAQLYDSSNVLKSFDGNPLPLSGYVNMTGSPDLITRENLATDDDYARQLALADLMGPQAGLLAAGTRGQAGTAQTDLGDFSQETIPAGPYQGITFTGSTAKPVADLMTKVKEFDDKNAGDIQQLFVGMENNRLHGSAMPTLTPQDKLRLQDYINRNGGAVPLRPEERDILFQKFGFTMPQPPPTPQLPPTPPGPVIQNPVGGDAGKPGLVGTWPRIKRL